MRDASEVIAEMRKVVSQGMGVWNATIAGWADQLEATLLAAEPADAGTINSQRIDSKLIVAGAGRDAELLGLARLWEQTEKSSERPTQFDRGYEQASRECADQLRAALASQQAVKP